MTFDHVERLRVHELLTIMNDAFNRYAATTDLQDTEMDLRAQRMREFADAYSEAIEILKAS